MTMLMTIIINVIIIINIIISMNMTDIINNYGKIMNTDCIKKVKPQLSPFGCCRFCEVRRDLLAAVTEPLRWA